MQSEALLARPLGNKTVLGAGPTSRRVAVTDAPDPADTVAATESEVDRGVLGLLQPSHGAASVVESAPPALQGPVFVADVDSLRNTQDPQVLRGLPGGPISGSQDLLRAVADMGVPIIYLSPKGNSADASFLAQYPPGAVLSPGALGVSTEKALQALDSAFPQAHFFKLSHDAAKPGQLTPDMDYLLNDDAGQKTIPGGFHGVLTDDFTPAFRAQVLKDLQNNVRATAAANPPPNHVGSLRGKLEHYKHDGQLLEGLPSELLQSARRKLFGDPDSVKFANALPAERLASESNLSLSALADRVLASPHADGVGQAFLRTITAHGPDAGHVDAILSMLHESPEKRLTGAALEQYRALRASHQATPGDWSGFETYMDNATGTTLRPGSKVEPLINGSTAFPVMLAAVDSANDHINVSEFAFQSDETGWEFAHHLAAAAGRGVKVRLIYDHVGSEMSNGRPTDPAIYDYLRQHGVEVRPQAIDTLKATHRKLIDIDSQTGFIGGMNIGNEYHNVWHDVHSKVTGPAVADIHSLFEQQWVAGGGAALPDSEKSVPVAVEGGGDVRLVGHTGHQDKNIKLAYLRAIDTAEHTINIADPYLTDTDVAEHLAAAARRGVQVNLVLPQHNDAGMTQFIEKTMYADLLAAGVHIFEYHGRPMAHDKVATFDGKMATIGSSNLDTRSMSYDDEANVWVPGSEVASRLDTELFGVDLAQSQAVTPHPLGLADNVKAVVATGLRLIQ